MGHYRNKADKKREEEERGAKDREPELEQRKKRMGKTVFREEVSYLRTEYVIKAPKKNSSEKGMSETIDIEGCHVSRG